MEDKKELKEIMRETKRLYDEQCKRSCPINRFWPIFLRNVWKNIKIFPWKRYRSCWMRNKVMTR